MSYQDAEILRDKNGNPIPQYFNVATGKFEPITGQNGSQNTQLTGSKVEVLKIYDKNDYYVRDNSEFYQRWGSNNRGSENNVIPIDVSRHTKRLILITNNYDVSLETVRVSLVVEADKTLAQGNIRLKEVELSQSIPAGASLIIDDTILPEINQPFQGIFLNVIRDPNEKPTTGTHTIVFLGAR